MEMFTEKEIKEIESMEDLKDMLNILDSVLDGEVFKVRNTDTDKTIDDNLKPVLPKGIVEAQKAEKIANKKIYAYVFRVLIALIIDLNPMNNEYEEDYCFRMAIIINAITSGCLINNGNWKYSDVTFDRKYIKEKGKEVTEKNKDLIKKIQDYLNPSLTFIAFSSMNMVRFNHHYPIEKFNLINKGLSNIPEAQRDRLLEEEKLESFYNVLVTAVRIVNDKMFYEKYILKKVDDNNLYHYYKELGAYDIEYEEEIIKIRSENTPNGFLILDIINEIYNDLKSKKILFAIPYKNEIAELLQLRRYLRLNPFAYHPAKGFYKCKAADYDQVIGKFQSLMKTVGSFIYQYSETMYESVRAAKCRNKYMKNITKEDEVLVKMLVQIMKVDISVNEKTIDIVKKKLSTSNIVITEETDITHLNTIEIEKIEKKIQEKFAL